MLIVNEVYGPVKQGEGKSSGLDVVFLRLSTCNLACVWCDTPYTWNWTGTKFVHPDKYDSKKEAHKLQDRDIIAMLAQKGKGITNLVISGGEPMLQQLHLVPFLRFLQLDKKWHVEIETNGTIEPTDELIALISQFNCSPKTGNSGPDNLKKKCIVLPALKKIAACGDKATFKFVIQSESDLPDAEAVIAKTGIQPYQVYLMPEGRTKEEQEMRQKHVEEMAHLKGYNFSPRLHILEFGNKRAV